MDSIENVLNRILEPSQQSDDMRGVRMNFLKDGVAKMVLQVLNNGEFPLEKRTKALE